MSTKEQGAPCPAAHEAERASTRALDTVMEIFGGLDHRVQEEEPVLIKNLRNGGRSRLQRRLHRGRFFDLKLREAESA